MHLLLLIVRYLLALLGLSDRDSVSMAARVDGRVQQWRRKFRDQGNDSGWSLFDFRRRRRRALARPARETTSPPVTDAIPAPEPS